MSPEQAVALLKQHSNLSEDVLTQVAQALGYTDMDRNFFHNNKAEEGRRLLDQRLQQGGGYDAVLKTAKTTANLPAQVGEQATAAQQAIDIEGLGRLASGNLRQTPEDRALIEANFGFARREMEATLPQLMDQTRARTGASGLTGGSADVANQAIIGAQTQRSLADLAGQQAITGIQMPFQRAGVQLAANESLWNQFIGSVNPLWQRELGYADLAQRREQAKMEYDTAKRGQYIKGITDLVP